MRQGTDCELALVMTLWRSAAVLNEQPADLNIVGYLGMRRCTGALLSSCVWNCACRFAHAVQRMVRCVRWLLIRRRTWYGAAFFLLFRGRILALMQPCAGLCADRALGGGHGIVEL